MTWRIATLLACVGASPLAGQEPVDSAAVQSTAQASVDSAAAQPTQVGPASVQPQPLDSVAPDRPSPTGALLRSLVLPGWGQASYGHYVRGGILLAGHVGNSFMLFKTLTSLDEVRDRLGRYEEAELARLRAEGVTDADSLSAGLDENAEIRRLRRLTEAREEQREDWIAMSLFWILISGADAFVQAQLADFPVEIAAVRHRDRMVLQLSVASR